jgi:hypothetical protein
MALLNDLPTRKSIFIYQRAKGGSKFDGEYVVLHEESADLPKKLLWLQLFKSIK